MFEAATLEGHLGSDIVARRKQKEKMEDESTKDARSKSSKSYITEDVDSFDWIC